MILGIDYFAAKRLVEFYEGLTASAGDAIGLRRTKTAEALNLILNAEAGDYIEAQRIVRQHEDEERVRAERMAQARCRERFGDQMLLAPRRDRAVGAL
jgi:hypothetical protein